MGKDIDMNDTQRQDNPGATTIDDEGHYGIVDMTTGEILEDNDSKGYNTPAAAFRAYMRKKTR